MSNPVLGQVQKLLNEDGASIAEALTDFSARRPEVAAFAWWHFFGSQPPWASSPDPPTPPQVVVPPSTPRAGARQAIADYNWIGKAVRAQREGVGEFNVAVAPELIAKCIAELGRLGWELIADEEATDGRQRLFLGTFRRL